MKGNKFARDLLDALVEKANTGNKQMIFKQAWTFEARLQQRLPKLILKAYFPYLHSKYNHLHYLRLQPN